MRKIIKYNIKLKAPYEYLKSYDISPDITLHKAIIMQAISDAISSATTRDETKKAKREAISWLFGNSKRFRDVCECASLEPSFVVKVAKEFIKLARTKVVKSSNQFSKGKFRKNYNGTLLKKVVIK